MMHTGGAGVRKGVLERTVTLSVKSSYLLQKRSPSELLPVSQLSNYMAVLKVVWNISKGIS